MLLSKLSHAAVALEGVHAKLDGGDCERINGKLRLVRLSLSLQIQNIAGRNLLKVGGLFWRNLTKTGTFQILKLLSGMANNSLKNRGIIIRTKARYLQIILVLVFLRIADLEQGNFSQDMFDCIHFEVLVG